MTYSDKLKKISILRKKLNLNLKGFFDYLEKKQRNLRGSKSKKFSEYIFD